MSDVPVFGAEPLTKRGHYDPDKHLIGEALGVASLEDVAFAGVETKTGVRAYPARSDHSHDIRMRKMSYWTTDLGAKVCPGGGTITDINTLSARAIEENWITGALTITPPIEGIYWVSFRFTIVRSVATFPATTRREIGLAMNNSATFRPNSDDNLPQGREQEILMINERIGTDASAVNFNYRHRYINHDTVDHNVSIFGYVMRLSSTAAAVES